MPDPRTHAPSADSAIASFAADGGNRMLLRSTTTAEEVAQLQALRVPGGADGDNPLPDALELRIDALSPQQREAYQQALREANRQGVSAPEAQQAASFAAANLHAPPAEATRAPQAVVELERQRDAPGPPAAAAQTVPSGPPPSVPHSIPAHLAAAGPVAQPDAPQPRYERETPPAPAATEHAAPPQPPASQLAAGQATPTPGAPPAPEHPLPPAQPQDTTRQAAAPTAGKPLASPSRPDMPAEAMQRQIADDHIHQHPGLSGITAASVQGAPMRPLPDAAAQATPAPAITPDILQERQHPPAQHSAPASATDARPHTGTESPHSTHRESTYLQSTPPPAAPATPAPALTPMQAGHPDHALYQQVRDGVAALDAKHGRQFDVTSERMTASLLVLAKGSGLERVDHVLLSNPTAQLPAAHNVFVVQGELNDPAHQRALMPTLQAAQTPVDESLQQFDVVSREQQQRLQAQQLEQQLHDEREQQVIQSRAASMG
ncbi:XVIPCD domain-containing protein [Stenotrophomonas rhizophila]|uniref:XVIPCD domain-containing protein n=1 Tax=Stenotrophomonas rhizophila TaxID=216778 RepID=UPI001E61EB38|nr:XVIPCD domain-containing protein [Stenotrophomonas rhizophila]MCC7633790.1 hypothetical protein [Stenotrophomonas rhizophila]MCC7663736.1 hypothetical protein [Stenotrophomonas rhizophila]